MAERHMVFSNGTADWSSVNSWAASRGGATGQTVPADGDTVYVESATAASITAGLDQSGIDLAALTISGPISADGLDIGVSGTCRVRGVTSLRLIADGDGIDRLTVHTTGEGDGVTVTSGTVPIIDVGRNAKVTIGASAVVTTLNNDGMCEAASNATAFTTVKTGGGVLKSYRSAATVRVFAGHAIGLSAAAISTKLEVAPGGLYTHHAYGTIADVEVFPGGKATGKGGPYGFTVTTRTIHDGALCFDDTPSATLSATINLGENAA